MSIVSVARVLRGTTNIITCFIVQYYIMTLLTNSIIPAGSLGGAPQNQKCWRPKVRCPEVRWLPIALGQRPFAHYIQQAVTVG